MDIAVPGRWCCQIAAYMSTGQLLCAGDQDYDFLEGGLGAAYFHSRVSHIRAALAKAGAALQQAAGAQAQQQSRLTLEQRAARLGEQPLPGTARPALHAAGGTVPNGAEAPTAAGADEGREALLQRAAAAGILGTGGGLASRFVSSRATPADEASTDSATGGIVQKNDAEGGTGTAQPAAAPGEPVRTQRDWAPDPLLCKRFNVPDPNQGKAAQKSGDHAQPDYLAAPPEQRAAMYTDSLPAHMRPPAQAAQQSSAAEPLPLPPKRPAAGLTGASAAALGATVSARRTDVFVDELLAAAEGDAPVEGSKEADGAVGEALPVNRPMDIFKAIFENSNDEASDSDTSSADAATAPGGEAQVAAGVSSQAAAAPATSVPLHASAQQGASDKAAGSPGAPGGLHAQRDARFSSPLVGQRNGQHSEDLAGHDADARVVFKPRAHRTSAEHAAESDASGDGSSGSNGDAPRRARSSDKEAKRERRAEKRRRKEVRKEAKKERRKREKRAAEEALVAQALQAVERGGRGEGHSAEQLAEMARALKKRSRRRERSGSDDSIGERRKRSKGKG